MPHLLLIFGLGLGGGGFLFREAHPQARDELAGQGAPREGQGQDGQALQCVLTAGPGVPEWHCQLLPGPARASTPSKWVLAAAQGWWEKLLGSFPPGRESRACNSCQPLPQLGTGKAGRERGRQPRPGLQNPRQSSSSGQSGPSSRQGHCLHHPTAGDPPLGSSVPHCHLLSVPGGTVSPRGGDPGAALLLPLTKLQ